MRGSRRRTGSRKGLQDTQPANHQPTSGCPSLLSLLLVSNLCMLTCLRVRARVCLCTCVYVPMQWKPRATTDAAGNHKRGLCAPLAGRAEKLRAPGAPKDDDRQQRPRTRYCSDVLSTHKMAFRSWLQSPAKFNKLAPISVCYGCKMLSL